MDSPSNPNSILDKIKKQIRENMTIAEEDDFESFFEYNGRVVLISFFKNREFNEYDIDNMEHWILLFEEEETHQRQEIWVPLNTNINEDDVVEIVADYIQEGYLEEVVDE